MSQIVPISAHLEWKWKTRPVPLPGSFVKAQRALGLKPAGVPFAFGFIRRKRGTEIWLVFTSGLRICLSDDNEAWPPSFKHARYWAYQFARDHGFTAREMKPFRMFGYTPIHPMEEAVQRTAPETEE